MSRALEKAKELTKKTNAAVIVVNETTDDAFVVMSLEEYEKLVNKISNFKFAAKGGSAPGGQISEDNKKEGGDLAQRLGESIEVSSGKQETAFTETGKGDRRAPTVVGARDDRKPELAALTEDELLAKINQEIGEWREGQTDKQNILLAEMPAQLSLKNDKGNERGGYNLVGAKVDFRVDNLEEEERYFLEPLD